MRALWVLLTVLIGTQVFSQQRVAYSPDFDFKEGVYLSFADFKNNNPIPITHIYSELDIRQEDYLERVLSLDTLIYYDNLLEERAVKTASVWGFSKRNKVYIGINTVQGSADRQDRDWFPILSIGAYSYFSATIIVTRFMPPTAGMGMGSFGVGMMGDPMFPDNGTYYDEAVTVHFLLEFATGSLIELGTGDLSSISPDLMMELLRPDPVLEAEFEAKSRSEQKQASMFYIRQFNQRNPIYLPL